MGIMSDSFHALLQSMHQPGFYPHAVLEPITSVQTHCSVVILTGDFAYKLKKAVDFGFLDYSSLEKRCYFLERELSLNYPIAPDIYLEILPISQQENQFILGDASAVVDYVLKMHQFPQDCLLINLFEQGKLTEAHIQELGQCVAQFHATTQTNNYIQTFGDIEIIKSSVDDNYQSTKKYIGIAQTQSHYEQTQGFTDDFLIQKKAIFGDRQRTGKIRECHGDLHLKNICYWHDKIQLFDRIEFNESFRFVDVMYDVAFTMMDLDARGRSDLGNLFLNTYLEQSGDWEGVQVLTFYLCRQAYVRAKVTSMLLDDPDIDAAEKQQAITVAGDYYQQAWRYTQPQPGQLIMMSGLSGAGKSTVARKLAQDLHGIQIRADAVRKQIAGLDLYKKGDASLYSSEMHRQTYGRLEDLARLLTRQGFTVILDAKYDTHHCRSPIISLSQAENIPLRIYHCQASLETIGDRLRQRRNDISDATVDLLPQQVAQWQGFSESELPLVTTINTELT